MTEIIDRDFDLQDPSPLPPNFIPLARLFDDIRGDLKPDLSQARIDRHERILRHALLSGALECFSYDHLRGCQPIPKTSWNEENFWISAHEPCLIFDRILAVPVVDRTAGLKAIGYTAAELRGLPNWLKEVPTEIQQLPLSIYLPLIAKWEASDGRDPSKRNAKSIANWLEKHWPNNLGHLADREKQFFRSLVHRRRPRTTVKQRKKSKTNRVLLRKSIAKAK